MYSNFWRVVYIYVYTIYDRHKEHWRSWGGGKDLSSCPVTPVISPLDQGTCWTTIHVQCRVYRMRIYLAPEVALNRENSLFFLIFFSSLLPAFHFHLQSLLFLSIHSCVFLSSFLNHTEQLSTPAPWPGADTRGGGRGPAPPKSSKFYFFC